MNSEEYYKLSRSLEDHHPLFYKMWELGMPIFTDLIPTAAIEFNKKGEYLSFIFNKNFFDSLDDRGKLFTISHEMLHVIFDHGPRLKDAKNRQIANIAADLVVNHSLVNYFGFYKTDLPNTDKYVWVDTVFKTNPLPPTNESFEFYYNLIYEKMDETNIQVVSTLDSHDILEDSDGMGQQTKQEIEDFISKNLSDKEQKELKDILNSHAGTKAGNQIQIVKKQIFLKKKKWETIIKKWSSQYDNYDLGYTWTHENKVIQDETSGLTLPAFKITNIKDKNRIKVSFFLDTSGSCKSLADRFFKAAMSLDEEKFDIDLFCFDTIVYPVDRKTRKLQGFGGTSFHCIEEYVTRNFKTYPQAIFIITDGMGDQVIPQYPKRWRWFLSTDYKYFIPKKSYTYNLSDFE